MACSEHPRSRTSSTLDPRYATSKSTIFTRPTPCTRGSNLAHHMRSMRHAHARACSPSHAAHRELLVDMRWSPGRYDLEEHGAVRILCAANDAPVVSTWAERCQVGAEAKGTFDCAPRTASHVQRCTRLAQGWQLAPSPGTADRRRLEDLLALDATSGLEVGRRRWLAGRRSDMYHAYRLTKL